MLDHFGDPIIPILTSPAPMECSYIILIQSIYFDSGKCLFESKCSLFIK